MRRGASVFVVAVGVVLLLGSYIYYTRFVVAELGREAERSGRMYGRIYEALADTSADATSALCDLARLIRESKVPVIVTDAEGWVYVADRENHRIQVFDSHGKFQTQWVNMHRPSGLYLHRGPSPRIYVGEIGGGVAVNVDMPNIGPRVSIYGAKGELLARLGNRPAGLEPGQFISPHGLAVDSRGDIYVGEVSYTNWGRRGPTPLRAMRAWRAS